MFFGLPGEKVDGGIFWRKALASGAVAAVIGEEAAQKDPPSNEDMVFVVSDPVAHWMGEMASVFWKRPSSQIDLIGVTGTNGKTTTTYLIEHLCKQSGITSALFGTLYNRWPKHSEVAIHTTAFGDVLQSQLAQAVAAGARLGVMEISSHALDQRRVAGCSFSGAVFTNLTQDHLDYHESMEAYFQSKALLFQAPLLRDKESCSVVNIDDPWGLRLSKQLNKSCWRASLEKRVIDSIQPELFLTDLNITNKGIEGVLHSPFGQGPFVSSLIGRFNLMNMLEAVGILIQHGVSLQELLPSIKSFSGVPGRMEQIKVEGDLPVVLVDYAHTPDGLKNALIALRSFGSGRLFCVFGCGGDRDRSKRPLMGAIASKFADHVTLTSDNPRTEDPQQILNDVLPGIATETELIIEIDRANAIQMAIMKALPGDIVLIAGKGHENYQILGLETIEFDDREIAKKILHLKLNP
ncbi:UDP-N-acetylmuramoylalanyl-D-glutamate--2,6- diaminopimelate ligase [Prochlorococcus marinus str. SS51]|nr:UDP-N-acetylmuramoylalanyl-D-glutamate--2,6- diaminopimelate ligase [Prochlorococcus marinus str. SS51]